MEFEWHIFPRFTALELCKKVQEFHVKKRAINQNISKDESSSCRCSMTSVGDPKTMNRDANLNAKLVSIYARNFPAGRWSFLGPGSETKWCSTDRKPGGKWDRVAELMMTKFGASGHPVFRATSPLSRGTLKSKGGEKLSFHFCADGDTIETVFRTIISASQHSLFGAVAEKCDEYSICQTSTGRLVAAEQSDPFFAPADLLIMTPTPSIEMHAQENLMQRKHKVRVKKTFHNQIN